MKQKETGPLFEIQKTRERKMLPKHSKQVVWNTNLAETEWRLFPYTFSNFSTVKIKFKEAINELKMK